MSKRLSNHLSRGDWTASMSGLRPMNWRCAPMLRDLALNLASTGYGSANSGPANLMPNPPNIPNAWTYSAQIVDKAGRDGPISRRGSFVRRRGAGCAARRRRGAAPASRCRRAGETAAVLSCPSLPTLLIQCLLGGVMGRESGSWRESPVDIAIRHDRDAAIVGCARRLARRGIALGNQDLAPARS